MYNNKQNKIKNFLNNKDIEIITYKENAEKLLEHFKENKEVDKKLLFALAKYLKYSLIKPVYQMSKENRKLYFFDNEYGNKKKLLTFKDMALYNSLKQKDPNLILDKVKKENTINYSLYYGNLGTETLRKLENFSHFENFIKSNSKNKKTTYKSGLYNNIFNFYKQGEINE